MPAYVILADGENERRFSCKEITTLGRDDVNDVVLDDPHVSRRHAMICRLQRNAYYVIDEGSINGTYLNAKRITVPTQLNHGDEIRIGSASMRFEHRTTAALASQPPTTARETMMMTQQSVEVVKIAILVADIRGFTRISESMPVRELTEVMNEWFRAATGCIKERHGIVDKFLGDCVYARWDVDDEITDAVLYAVDAACQLNRISQRINATHPELPQPLALGVGINFGVAAIGTDQGRTAMGDAVNLTFRLQAQSKVLHKDIVMADQAYKMLPETTWSGREQRVSVAGKTKSVNVMGLSFDEATTLLRLRADARLS